MLSLHINRICKLNVLNIKQLNFFKKKLINKINILKNNKKNIYYLPQTKNRLNENPIKHIIGITLTNSNTNLYFSDIKGKIKFFLSSGFLGLNGKQKIKKPVVLVKLVRYVLSKLNFLSNHSTALHLKNFTKFYASLVITLLNKYILLELIRVYNNKPHNGCRPKKIKRKKRGTVIFKN